MGFYFWCPQSFRVIVSDFLCGTPPRLSEPDGSFKFVRLAELDFFFLEGFACRVLPSVAEKKSSFGIPSSFFSFFFVCTVGIDSLIRSNFFFLHFIENRKKNNRPPPFMVRKVSVLKKKKVCIRFSFFFTSASTSPFFSFLFFFWGGEGYPSEAISIVWMRRPDVEPQAKEKKEEKEVAKRRSKKRLDSPCLSLDFPRSRDSLWLPLSFSACVCVCVCVCV